MEEQVIKWVNNRGSVYISPRDVKGGDGKVITIPGRKIKRGIHFEAKKSELPKNGFDVIKPVHPIDPIPEIIPIVGFKIIPKDDKPEGWFDVINVISKKPINNKGLRKEEADLMLSNLLEG